MSTSAPLDPMSLPAGSFDPSAANAVGDSASAAAPPLSPSGYDTMQGRGGVVRGDNTPADPSQAPAAGGVNPVPGSATQGSQVGDIAQGMAQAAQSDQPTEGPQQPVPFWRSILLGALSGIANHAKGAVEGLYTGGIPGMIRGAADPKAAEQEYRNVGVQNQAATDYSQARARQLADSVKNTEDEHPLNMALLLSQTVMSQKQAAMMPDSLQEKILQENAETGAQWERNGAHVVATFDNLEDANQYALAAHGADKNSPFQYQPLAVGDGKVNVYYVNNPNEPVEEGATLPFRKVDGTRIEVPVPAGSMNVGQWMLERAQRNHVYDDMDHADYILKQKNTNAQTIQDKKDQTAKDVADTKANAAVTIADKKAAANASDQWVPKVSADEKKKAELAENIAFNANEVASLLMRRPDIVGVVAGRFTNAEQMTGNNDPDISALGTHIHNIAMANSGVHGFRSQQGVESYEHQLLNNFRNGPAAVAGALRASVGSVQTFIDNARPATYPTHSKQGGALRGMTRVNGGNQ